MFSPLALLLTDQCTTNYDICYFEYSPKKL